MVQSVCTFQISGTYVFTPEMGFRKIEFQSSTDSLNIPFKITGSIPFTSSSGEVQPSGSVSVRTPFTLQSLGNTALGDITIDANETLSVIAFL